MQAAANCTLECLFLGICAVILAQTSETWMSTLHVHIQDITLPIFRTIYATSSSRWKPFLGTYEEALLKLGETATVYVGDFFSCDMLLFN